jgi:hypothetical protein
MAMKVWRFGIRIAPKTIDTDARDRRLIRLGLEHLIAAHDRTLNRYELARMMNTETESRKQRRMILESEKAEAEDLLVRCGE